MNDRRPTELELAAALRAHLPATATADLRERIQMSAAGVAQQRPLPSVLGALTDADPVARQRTMLMVAAVLVAAALAGAAVLGALNFRDRTPVPLGRQGPIAFVRDGDLLLANPDGTGAVAVAHVDGAALSKPHWSADGALIAVQTEEPAILLYDRADGTLRRLASGLFGAWSPDATSVALFTSNGDIAIADVDTGATRILVARPDGTDGFGSEYATTFDNEPLAWSPDGRWLIANGTADYPALPFSLIRIDVDTAAVQALDTTEEFYQYQADWAPDSTRIAFAVFAERRLSDRFWVTNLDGSATEEIVERGASVLHPVWSPNGESIAYISMNRSARSDRLMIVRPDGTGALALAENVEAIVGWSPDGTSLAYTPPTDESRPRELHVVTIEGADRLLPTGGGYDFAVAGSVQDEPPTASGPSLPAAIESTSPERLPEPPPPGEPLQPEADWGGIAFRTQVDDFDCHLGVLRFPDTFSVVSPARTASPAPREDTGPGTPEPQLADMCELRFAPDGSSVLRASQRDASFDIVRMDGTVRSGPFPTIGAPPSWSPGGGWVEMPFCDDAGDCSRVVIMRPDGSDRHELPGRPAWSPGDRVLAVAMPDGTLLAGNGDGSGLREIGAFPLPVGWSPDASTFVFVRDGDAWLAQADGSGAHNLTKFELGGATGAWWSPDGRWIVVLQGQTAWAMSPDGSTRQRLGTNLGPLGGGWGPAWSPAWSPDGSSVAIEHGAEVTLFGTNDWQGVLLENASQPAWSPDGQHLAVFADAGNGVYKVDLANADGTGRATATTSISYPPIAWFR